MLLPPAPPAPAVVLGLSLPPLELPPLELPALPAFSLGVELDSQAAAITMSDRRVLRAASERLKEEAWVMTRALLRRLARGGRVASTSCC